MVRSSGRGTVLVRSRYARGALPVRCVSLTFQQAILYVYVSIYNAGGYKNE